MALPSLADWRERILAGIKAPVTPSNVKFLNAWAQAEGGTATNNPFNTTQPMPGATIYNTLDSGGHVWKYPTPQAGIQATVQTLKGPIGNYAPILAALRQGTDPMAAAKAVAGSQWGTGAGVERVLGGSSVPTTTTATPALPAVPAGPTVPTGPALPKALPIPEPKPVQFLDTPDFSTAIANSLGKSPEAMTQAIVNASQAGESAIWSQASRLKTQQAKSPGTGPVTTPMAQAARPPKMTIPTEDGHTIQVESRGASVKDLAVAKLACHFIGTPYSWGGGGPGGPSLGFAQGAHTKGFDCSSLLQFVWAKQGVNIPRVTYDQWDTGKAVPKNNLRAGDAVFFHPGPQGPEHVGMYLGNGKFIEAPFTGASVRISKLAGRGDYMGARRFA